VPPGRIRVGGRALHGPWLPRRRLGPRKSGLVAGQQQNHHNHQAPPVFCSMGHNDMSTTDETWKLREHQCRKSNRVLKKHLERT